MSVVLGSFIARGGFDITPDDDNDLAKRAFGVFCKGASGNVDGVCDDGTTLTDMPIVTGDVLPFIFVRILESSTATGLVGINAWKVQ